MFTCRILNSPNGPRLHVHDYPDCTVDVIQCAENGWHVRLDECMDPATLYTFGEPPRTDPHTNSGCHKEASMNDNAAQWVKALRDGTYKQGKARLRRGDTFCCLGVACDLYAKATGAQWDETERFLGESYILPDPVTEWLGLRDRSGGFHYMDGTTEDLTQLNDAGASFQVIARIIEHTPEMFVED